MVISHRGLVTYIKLLCWEVMSNYPINTIHYVTTSLIYINLLISR